jgi:LysM repeat protein
MKAKIVALLFVITVCKKGVTQNSADIIRYISTYKDFAISEMQRTGIPASIILAQGIHETEAGTSDLVKKSNNHFGIKCKDGWTGLVVYHDDDKRGECFRGYDSPLDSYKDHSDFLRNSSRYSPLFKIDPMDYEDWALGLKRAGYATNIHYSQILIRLIKEYNLQQYSLIALGKLRPEQETLVSRTREPSFLPAPGGQEEAAESQKTKFPSGEFQINKTRVIFAKSGTSMLALSEQSGLPLSRLLEFNDLKEEDILLKDQLLYLQRKRKQGAAEFHIVQNGETLYIICQEEGIRYESLLTLNRLSEGEEPAAGEKIYLQFPASSRPALVGESARN